MRVEIATHGRGGEATQAVLRAAFYAFLAVGIAALSYAGYAVLDLYWFQHVEIPKLEAVPAIVSPPASFPDPAAPRSPPNSAGRSAG